MCCSHLLIASLGEPALPFWAACLLVSLLLVLVAPERAERAQFGEEPGIAAGSHPPYAVKQGRVSEKLVWAFYSAKRLQLEPVSQRE
jgi:hypothetical protein